MTWPGEKLFLSAAAVYLKTNPFATALTKAILNMMQRRLRCPPKRPSNNFQINEKALYKCFFLCVLFSRVGLQRYSHFTPMAYLLAKGCQLIQHEIIAYYYLILPFETIFSILFSLLIITADQPKLYTRISQTILKQKIIVYPFLKALLF